MVAPTLLARLDSFTSAQVTNFGNLPLFITRCNFAFFVDNSVPDRMDWRSDKPGSLSRMGLVRSHVTLFVDYVVRVYLFAGPTRPRVQQYAQYMPPQQPQYNPQQPQNYRTALFQYPATTELSAATTIQP